MSVQFRDAIECSTSLPGGNQVDGLPPAPVDLRRLAKSEVGSFIVCRFCLDAFMLVVWSMWLLLVFLTGASLSCVTIGIGFDSTSLSSYLFSSGAFIFR